MVDFMGMMKKAQAMQSKLAEAQDDLSRLEVEGQSGGGMVKIVVTGKGEMKSIALDASLLVPTIGRCSKISSSPPSPTPRARPTARRQKRCRSSPPACRCRPA